MKNGWKLEGLFWLLTLRIIRGITFVIYAADGYQRTKLPWITSFRALDDQIYATYSPTWPSLIRRAMRLKGQKLSSHQSRKKKYPIR